MSVSQLFAHHSAILGLHQTIIVAVPGSAFGKANQELVQESGYCVVYEFTPVVGMKASDEEREPC